MWDLLYEIQDIVSEYGVDILPEIHEHYTIQHKIAEKGFWIYDFASTSFSFTCTIFR